MSCVDCRIDYLMDKIAVLETCVRRVNNVMQCSENSAEVTDAKTANIIDIRDFEGKWGPGRECEHKARAHEQEDSRVGEIFTPPKDGKAQPALDESRGNIGINSIPARAFNETSRPVQGSRGGRPVGGAGKGSKGRSSKR